MLDPPQSVESVDQRAGRARGLARLTLLSAWQGLVGFYQSDNLTYAASIAYYTLLSLFPLFMLALALLGRMTADEANRNAVLEFVLQYFPAQFDFITRQVDALRASRLGLSVAGMAMLVWGALGVFGAISTAVNHAWGVEERRGFWKHKLLTFFMLLVAGAMLFAAVVLVSASQVVGAGWFAQVLEEFPGLGVLRGIAVSSATTLLFILVVGLVYYFVPNTTVRFRDVWIGAIVTGLLTKSALSVFSWYLRDVSPLARVNGSIAVVVAFLLWVYTQAVLLLYGVEFTAAYAKLRRGGKVRRTRGVGASTPSLWRP